MRRCFTWSVTLFVLSMALATCAVPPKVVSLSYRTPFLGRKALPAELEWLRQVRLAAYCQLPTDQDKEEFVRDIDVDMMDWYCTFSANRGDFMRKRGIRVAGPEEFEYQEALQFTKPDTVAIFADNGIAVKLDGTPAAFPPTLYNGSYFMCHNAPKWHEMVNQGLVRLVPFGHSISQDNIGCPLNKGQGNFCKWCNTKFKRYLRERFSADQIAALGITDLDSFEARPYILDKVKNGGNEKAIEDPLVREYIRFQYISEADAWESHMRVIRAESAQLGLPMRAVYGNQYGAWGHLPFATALSSRADVVWIECGAYQPTWADEKQAWNALIYKIGAASGHFRRPVWTWPIGYSDNQVFLRTKMKLEIGKSRSGEPHIGYLRSFPIHMVLCEGLAEGGMVVMRPGDRTGTEVYKLHVKYARFVSDNRALFAERTRYVNAAVIYSFPTWMWRGFSSLSVAHDSRDWLPAIARVLEEAHIPYEANLFGHRDVWDDTEVLASLGKYDAIVLPAVDCMSDKQADALRSYVSRGGTLIYCGDLGTRDEDFKLRATPALADLAKEARGAVAYGKGKVVRIVTDDLKAFLTKEKREDGYTKIRDTVLSAVGEKALLRTNAPRTLWTNCWAQEEGRRLCVHVINYDADVDKDAMVPAKEIEVSLKTPAGFAFDRVVWIPFGGAQSVLPHKIENGRVVFTLPEVAVYGIAVLTSGRELEIANMVDSARRVREQLAVARENSDGCPREIWALTLAAECAMKRGDCATAESAARRVLDEGGKLLKGAVAESVAAEKRMREEMIASGAKAALAFDFGSGAAAAGWKQVKSDLKYDPKVGFGWDETKGIRSSDSGHPDALYADSINGNVTRTFSADIPNGDYIVTVACGHPTAVCTRASTAVVAEGQTKLLGRRSYGGVFFNRSFAVKVADGQLNITFPAPRSLPLAGKVGAQNPFAWNVCGLRVCKAGEGPAPADLALNEAIIAGGLRNWAVVGPFDDSGCEGMEIQYAPESALDLKATYKGKNGANIYWQGHDCEAGVAAVSFRELFDEDDGVVGFASTKIFVPSETKARLWFGSTGIGQVWLNGTAVLRDYTLAGLMADELQKDVELRGGWNDLLVKVCNKWGGEWAFSASLLDRDGRPIPGMKTSPTGGLSEPILLAAACPVAYPSIESESSALEFGGANEVSVVVENIATQAIDGSLDLSVEESLRSCVRIEPGGAVTFAGLKRGEQLSRAFKVWILRLPPECDYVSLRACLKAAGMTKIGTARLKVSAPVVLLKTYDPAKEPGNLRLDSMDDVSSWTRNGPQSVQSLSADTKDKKEGGASLCAVRTNNGDGVEDFARIQRDFPEGTDWTGYSTLRYWAKVTDEDPAVKIRPICVVLNNRDGGGYQSLGRHDVPVGQWTQIEDDLVAIRRENVASLVPHLYETYLDKKTSYTWRLDDMRLVKGPQPATAGGELMGPDEVAARLYVSNATSTALDATVSLVPPTAWRCDLPPNMKANVPSKRAWCTTCRLTPPPNVPGLAYPVMAKLLFASGASLEVKQEVQAPKRVTLGVGAKAPVLDGKLDDEAWKACAPIGNFVLNDGSGLAQAQSRAWLCRDAANLYIAFECLEPAMAQLRAAVKERDGQVWTDDCVEVFIQPRDRDLYHLVFNPLDVLRDEGHGEEGWNSHATSKTVRGADLWTIELAIPFADMGGAPKPGDTWRINLNRTRPEKPNSAREFSCWSCTYGGFAQPDRFAEVTFK